MTSTNEIKEKLIDALWPFHPDNQPEQLVSDYNAFLKKVGATNNAQLKNEHYNPTAHDPESGSQVHNPFAV
jgi:hypothetical protein